LAVTPHAKTFRRLQLVWGVLPILGVAQKNTDDLTKEAITRSIRQGYIKEEDLVVVTAGVPVGMTGTTNMIQVHIAKTFLESH
jgi:pyruvate kinase